MKETIIWRTENDGSIEIEMSPGNTQKMAIVSLKEGILWSISDYMLRWVKNPKNVQNNSLFTNIVHNTFSPLRLIYPRISISKCDFIVNSIQKNMIYALNNHILPLSLTNNDLSNFEFLLLLGKRRIWNNGCVICLDDVAGHKCECGYNNVIICRPCGHSYCPQPCFEKILKSFDHETIKINSDGSYLARNYDLLYDRIICPTCRTKVTSVFCSQHIITDNLYKTLGIYEKVILDLENFAEPEVVVLPKLPEKEMQEYIRNKIAELLSPKK
jgi:hypothetical protein